MASRATDQSANARKNLLDMKGLGDVIISTSVNTGNLVTPAISRSQDQHRHLSAVSTPAFENTDPVHLWEAYVENDRVIGFGIAEKMPLFSIECTIHDVSGIHESVGNLTIEILVVLDHEYAHCGPYQLPLLIIISS